MDKHLPGCFAFLAISLVFISGVASVYSFVIIPHAKIQLELQEARNAEIELKQNGLRDIFDRGRLTFQDASKRN